MRNQPHLSFLCHALKSAGAGQRARRVKPRPLALRRVQMQAKGWASSLEDLPDLLEQLDVTNDASVIHVPLVVHRIERRDLVHKAVDAATEVKWAQRVALLHAAARPEDGRMVVE